MTSSTAPHNPTNGNRIAANEQTLAVMSEIVDRLRFAQRHGLQYDGDRDLYRVGGYPVTLQFSDYWSLYERDPIAARIIDMPAETTWRHPPEITVEGDAETDFGEQVKSLVDRLGLWNRLERADRLARVGRFGVLLIGVQETDARLTEPLGTLEGPDDVLYLSAYSEGETQINRWVTDPNDPRFGQPELYSINLSSGIPNFRPDRDAGLTLIHWSRVVHIAEDLMGDEVYGRPVLRPLFNDLMDLQKVSTSTAEAFWQRVAGILQARFDKDVKVTPEQLKEVDEVLKELYHDLRKTVYGNFDLNRIGDTEPDPSEAADLYMTRIAAGAGIPKRILFGSETGERSSTEDQKTFLGSIQDRQTQHAEPNILRALLGRLIEHSGLPRPRGDEYDVVWPTLFSEPEIDIADANLKRAQAAKALTPVGGDPYDIIEVDEDRNVFLRETGERGPVTPAEREPPEPVTPPPGGPPNAGEGDE